ncbi:hypothetical protein L804_04735 [Cryptococcus deuterogattii 2001/935-1]|nr:hypothetical protein L804_04735 [Cryptococcus deuterogattii 2001/935-1]
MLNFHPEGFGGVVMQNVSIISQMMNMQHRAKKYERLGYFSHSSKNREDAAEWARSGVLENTLFNVSDSEKVGAAPITTSTNTSIHQSQNEKDDPNILQVPPSSSAMRPTGSMSLLNSIESNESIWSWKSQSK